ncbi:MAG: alpha/beta hydrolase-fold protein [Steroidobacteraceae bacterium]
MTLREVQQPLGAPWRQPLEGRLDQLVVESEALAGNALGDPVRRPLYVYCSPGVACATATSVASVYVLQGLGGQLDLWLGRDPFEPTIVERIDALYGAAQPPCPQAVIVFVDAWTALGGAQFLNSSATGDYSDYICDEVVPFVDAHYPTDARGERRAVAGKSSGGYGAMVLPMLRPGVFGGLVTHAGDALFEVCYMPDFAKAARALRDHFGGSLERFWEDFGKRERFDWGRHAAVLNVYAMAAAYSPDADHPGKVLLPFDTTTGQLIDELWERWLLRDPVRMAARHAAELGALRHIHIEAGRSDEFMLDLGAAAFSAELERLGVAHSFELFDGGHSGISHRYAPAIRNLLTDLEG